MSAGAEAAEGLLFLLDYLLRLLRVAVLLSLWRTVMAGRGEVGGLTLAALLTYTLVGEAFARMLNPRTQIHIDLWQGTVATRWLQPLGVFAQYGADAAGRWALDLALFALPLYALAPLLGVNPWPASPAAAAWFLVSLALGVAAALGLEFVLGALMVVWQLPVFTVYQVRQAITALLSGGLLPLAVLPWGLGQVLAWLPFASLAWAPLAIYTGAREPLGLVALQAFWAAVLWLLAGRLWAGLQEKLVAYGG
jgi:ABC-type uncharacterized transport system permease subunit